MHRGSELLAEVAGIGHHRIGAFHVLDQQRLGHVERQAAVDANAGGAEVEGVVSGEHRLILLLVQTRPVDLVELQAGVLVHRALLEEVGEGRVVQLLRRIVAVLAVAGRVVCAGEEKLVVQRDSVGYGDAERQLIVDGEAQLLVHQFQVVEGKLQAVLLAQLDDRIDLVERFGQRARHLPGDAGAEDAVVAMVFNPADQIENRVDQRQHGHEGGSDDREGQDGKQNGDDDLRHQRSHRHVVGDGSGTKVVREHDIKKRAHRDGDPDCQCHRGRNRKIELDAFQHR